jgi:hypothetical protein
VTIPGLASLAKDGKLITLSGTLKDATAAQIDFVRLSKRDGETVPEAMEIAKTTDGTFSVKAPATLSEALYLIVNVDQSGDGPSPDDVVAVVSVDKIVGKDIELKDIDCSKGNKSNDKIPWEVRDMKAPTGGTPKAGENVPPPPNPAAEAAKAPKPPVEGEAGKDTKAPEAPPK